MINAYDLVLVSEEGKPVMPTKHKVNTSGFLIHAALHKARPDVNAACHTHSPYGRAWSAFGRPLEMLSQGECSQLMDDKKLNHAIGEADDSPTQTVASFTKTFPSTRALAV